MKIGIIGYGKMGKSVEKIAQQKNHNIIFTCHEKIPSLKILKQSDVVIEFSHPSCTLNHIQTCMYNNIPMICGTTGWIKKLNIAKKICEKKSGSLLYSSNFNIGMNIVFEIVHKLSNLFYKNSLNYDIKIEEIHHKNKIDKPSGTAITIADKIINNNIKKDWILKENKIDIDKNNYIQIISKRIENIIGIHKINFTSTMDIIEINHTSNNRDVFANGAIIAAEWIINKKGFFTMKDVLHL